MSRLRRTERQGEIMRLVLSSARRGAWLDIDELHSMLADAGAAPMTKQALQCSIRILERAGLLVRDYALRRERRRMVLTPTARGLAAFGGVPAHVPAPTIVAPLRGPESAPGTPDAGTAGGVGTLASTLTPKISRYRPLEGFPGMGVPPRSTPPSKRFSVRFLRSAVTEPFSPGTGSVGCAPLRGFQRGKVLWNEEPLGEGNLVRAGDEDGLPEANENTTESSRCHIVKLLKHRYILTTYVVSRKKKSVRAHTSARTRARTCRRPHTSAHARKSKDKTEQQKNRGEREMLVISSNGDDR